MRKVLIVGIDWRAASWASETYERITELLPDHEVLVVNGMNGVIEITAPDKPRD